MQYCISRYCPEMTEKYCFLVYGANEIFYSANQKETFIYSALLFIHRLKRRAEMADVSGFRAVIEFLDKLGVYDVILPFLLVFTIFFAILEKTKILGMEKIDGKEYSKKNINAIVSFVVAMLVIASTKLVAVISEVMANVILLVILGVSFLMLVGTFFKSEEFSIEKFKGWKEFLIVLMFIGIVLIFLNALDWLKYVFALFVYWDADWAVSIIFVIVIVLFMYFIVKGPSKPKDEGKGEH